MGQAPAAGAVSVRTFNRNFPGRSGTAGRPRLSLLAGDCGRDRARAARSPTRASSASCPTLTPPSAEPRASTTGRSCAAAARAGAAVELEKGRNIVPPPPVPAAAGRDRRPRADRRPRRRLDRRHGPGRRARPGDLVEHPGLRPLHVPPLRPGVPGAGGGLGRRHRRRRAQLRPGLEPRAGRVRRAPPRRPRRRRQELRAHPPHEPDRAGDPPAHLRRRGRLRAGRSRATSG